MPNHEPVLGRTRRHTRLQATTPKAQNPVPRSAVWGGGGTPRLAGLYGHPRAKAPASRSVGNHELGMVLEAYDAKDDRTHVKRK